MSGLRSLHTMNLFSRFFQENQEKFLAFAYSYLRDKAEAEDVVMESMIALWENRDRWEENSNLHAPSGFLFVNTARNGSEKTRHNACIFQKDYVFLLCKALYSIKNLN